MILMGLRRLWQVEVLWDLLLWLRLDPVDLGFRFLNTSELLGLGLAPHGPEALGGVLLLDELPLLEIFGTHPKVHLLIHQVAIQIFITNRRCLLERPVPDEGVRVQIQHVPVGLDQGGFEVRYHTFRLLSMGLECGLVQEVAFLGVCRHVVSPDRVVLDHRFYFLRRYLLRGPELVLKLIVFCESEIGTCECQERLNRDLTIGQLIETI